MTREGTGRAGWVGRVSDHHAVLRYHHIDRRSPSKYGLSEDSHMRQTGLLSWPCPSPALMGAGGINRASASILSPQQCSGWRFSGDSLEGTLSAVVTSLSLSKAILSHFASLSTHYSWLEVSQQLRATFVEPSRLDSLRAKCCRPTHTSRPHAKSQMI